MRARPPTQQSTDGQELRQPEEAAAARSRASGQSTTPEGEPLRFVPLAAPLFRADKALRATIPAATGTAPGATLAMLAADAPGARRAAIAILLAAADPARQTGVAVPIRRAVLGFLRRALHAATVGRVADPSLSAIVIIPALDALCRLARLIAVRLGWRAVRVVDALVYADAEATIGRVTHLAIWTTVTFFLVATAHDALADLAAANHPGVCVAAFLVAVGVGAATQPKLGQADGRIPDA